MGTLIEARRCQSGGGEEWRWPAGGEPLGLELLGARGEAWLDGKEQRAGEEARWAGAVLSPVWSCHACFRGPWQAWPWGLTCKPGCSCP